MARQFLPASLPGPHAAALACLGVLATFPGPLPAQIPAPAIPDGILVEDPEAKLRTLNALFTAKQWGDAAAGYNAFLAAHPDSTAREEILYKLAECHRELKETAAAAATLDQLLAAFPNGAFAPFARIRKGQMLLEEGKPDEALALFTDVIQTAKTPGLRLNAQFYSILALQRLQRTAETVPLLEALDKVESNNPFRAFAALGLGRHAESRGDLRAALARYQKALALADTPEMRGEAGVRAGIAALQLREWKEAAGLFDTVRRLDAPPRWKSHAAIGALRAAFYGRDYATAATLFPAVESSLPESARQEALYIHAAALRLTGKTAPAIEAYTRLLGPNPAGPFAEAAEYERLLCFAERRDADTGKAAKGFLQRHPKSSHAPTARYLLADFLYQGRDYAGAEPLLAEITASGHPKASQEDALFKLAWSRLALKQWDAAIAAFQSLLARFPSSKAAPDALAQIAAAHEQRGALPEAAAAIDRLLKNHPDAPQTEAAWLRKGVILARLQRYADVRATLSDWLETYKRSPRVPTARYWRGWAAFHQGDYANAVPDLEAARKTNPADFQGPATERLAYAAYQLKQRDTLDARLAEWDAWRAAHPGESQAPDPAMLLWLASQFLDARDFPKAEAWFLRVLETKNPTLRSAALFGAGLAQLQTGKPASAVKHLETFRAENPAEAGATKVLLPLARAYNAAGLHDQAQPLAEQVMTNDPEGTPNAEARLALADALAGRNQFNDAAKYYASVALLYDDPELTPKAYLRAAEAYRQAGNETEAARLDAERLRRFPNANP